MPPDPPDITLNLDLGLTAEDFEGPHRYTFNPFERRWDGDGPVPTRTTNGVEDVPVLRDIHPRRWVEVLTRTTRERRRLSYTGGGLTSPEIAAILDLMPRLPAPPDGTVDHPGIALEPPAAPPRTTKRQLNIRVPDEEYADLARAARNLGTRPSELARMLVVTGVRNMLADQR